jgi:hypothetical protein
LIKKIHIRKNRHKSTFPAGQNWEFSEILQLPSAQFLRRIAAMTLETCHATVVFWRSIEEDWRCRRRVFPFEKMSNIHPSVTLPSFY